MRQENAAASGAPRANSSSSASEKGNDEEERRGAMKPLNYNDLGQQSPPGSQAVFNTPSALRKCAKKKPRRWLQMLRK